LQLPVGDTAVTASETRRQILLEENVMSMLRTKGLSVAMAAMVALAGCSSWSGAQKGTAIGVGAGAAVGHAVGGGVLGTVGGAAVGGVVGHEIGKKQDEKDAGN